MKILIQKFGGTSVANKMNRSHVFHKIEHAIHEGYALVIVISAMGRSGDPYATDTLLSLLDPGVDLRERDLLYSCGEIISGCILTGELQAKGFDAIFLTGASAGIITENQFLSAPIKTIQTEKILKHLQSNKIVVVAGSQGISEEGNVTSLGRGGSDITATALGSYLGVERVEIYTDVDGIMTGDPKIIDKAKIIPFLSFENSLNMAKNGAKIIHPQAIEAAFTKNETEIVIKSTFSNEKGTIISKKNKPIHGLLAVSAIQNISVVEVETKELAKINTIIQTFRKVSGFELIVKDKSQALIVCPNSLSEWLRKKMIKNGYQINHIHPMTDLRLLGSFQEEDRKNIIDIMRKHKIDVYFIDSSAHSIRIFINEKLFRKAINIVHDYYLSHNICI